AILRVYNARGRRDNKYKARIKILVASDTIDAFRRQVDAEWDASDKARLDWPAEELLR
ncbi:MAG TPA: sulfite reductase, partial [Parvularcula sp.]|nr:sulfite reductase [Parvularcula sp.]